MGYQSRRSPGSSGRGHGGQQRKKAKAKVTREKRRSSSIYMSEEKHVPTLEEVSNKTRNRLFSLGNQRFALSPFSEYFGQWLVDLRDVMFEFESSPTINVDGQFLKERSQILSSVEASLEERRREEATLDGIIKGLSENRIILEQIEEEYNDKTREIEERKAKENRRLSSNIDSLKEELDRIAQMKTGIFRRVSEKAKAQKEAEATQRLNSEQRELELAMHNFGAEEEKLRDEYEKKKQPIIEQIRDQQKEIENLEIDGSIETRRAACDALGNAVNELQRKGSSLQ